MADGYGSCLMALPSTIAISHVSARQRGERWFGRRPRRIQHHREHRVVADEAEGIDDALLAEFSDGALVGRVAHAAIAGELVEEGVEDLLVLGHPLRPAAFRDRLDDVG